MSLRKKTQLQIKLNGTFICLFSESNNLKLFKLELKLSAATKASFHWAYEQLGNIMIEREVYSCFNKFQVQVQVHLFTLIQLQYNNYKEKKGRSKKKTELTIHWIKHNKGKERVAAKGAKLLSWLLPQSGYKWVEVIQ